jgi:hypothetical protein
LFGGLGLTKLIYQCFRSECPSAGIQLLGICYVVGSEKSNRLSFITFLNILILSFESCLILSYLDRTVLDLTEFLDINLWMVVPPRERGTVVEAGFGEPEEGRDKPPDIVDGGPGTVGDPREKGT